MKNITFINAGAGSGKTYRLTTDLARKLTQGGLDPSQVILTTYTELAAAEIREKARKEILNAKDANNVPVAADVRIKNATQLDNAFIGTVHAISFRFIRKYWYLLNYGADIQPMSDQNQDFYMSQSISDIVTDDDRKVFREFRATFNIKDSYSHPDHLFWLPELKAIVDKMEYYDINNVVDSIKESINTAQNIFCGWTIQECFQKINYFLPSFKNYLANINSKKSAKYQHTLELLNYELRDAADFRADGLKDCMTEQIGTAQQKRNFYDTPDYQNALNAYKESFISTDYLPLIEEYLEKIFDLAVRWRKALLTYKQENHIISFDDMEKIFLSMLMEPQYKEVQDDIKNNFRLLMVDEFQDSNPIQLKIFNRISELIAENGGESIWVGDPKQAIYGFRGSDSRFISEILNKFIFDDNGKEVSRQGEELLGTDQLLESWRSRPALVEFANQIFLEPFKKSGLKEKQITLEPHHKDTDTMRGQQALYVWRTEQGKSEPRARMLAAQIKKLIDSSQQVHHQECDKPTSEITYRDIAVLCYSNAECNKVAAQLRKIGLPASCEETNLMQCIEVYLLKTLLLFVQNPGDKMLRAELAIMLDDATTENILKDRINYVAQQDTSKKGWDHWMDCEHQHAETINKLGKLTERYQNLSVFDAIVAIHEELDLNNIIAKWGDITQRKHNLATVVNMAKAYDDMCLQMDTGSSILGFINYLTVTKPENKPDNSANTIKVLTYHHSKGLEWPVVILYQLWKDMNNEEDLAKKQFCGANVCRIEDTNSDIFTRQHYINLFPSGVGGAANSKMSELMLDHIYTQPLFKDIKNRTAEEALRLLYVGVTRAKDILVSVTSKKNTKEGGDIPSCWPKNLCIGTGSSEKPFGEGHGETLVELEESIYPSAEESTEQYSCTNNTPGINDAPLLMLSPSTITAYNVLFADNVEAGKNDERIIDMNMFAGESNDAVKGTCIHNIFAAYIKDDNNGNLQRTTQTLANFGFPNVLRQYKERLLASAQWLYDYLTTTYGEYTQIEKECPLLYSLPSGQVLRGEIDLLWHYRTNDGDEKCVLIDYKTFPGRSDQLKEHTEKYYEQLSAYHAALTAAGITVADTLIYYPVQAHVRKLIHREQQQP